MILITMSFSGNVFAAAAGAGDDGDDGRRPGKKIAATAMPLARSDAVKPETEELNPASQDTEATVPAGGSQETTKTATAEESPGTPGTDNTLPSSQS